jgi:hypothetical protein
MRPDIVTAADARTFFRSQPATAMAKCPLTATGTDAIYGLRTEIFTGRGGGSFTSISSGRPGARRAIRQGAVEWHPARCPPVVFLCVSETESALRTEFFIPNTQIYEIHIQIFTSLAAAPPVTPSRPFFGHIDHLDATGVVGGSSTSRISPTG